MVEQHRKTSPSQAPSLFSKQDGKDADDVADAADSPRILAQLEGRKPDVSDGAAKPSGRARPLLILGVLLLLGIAIIPLWDRGMSSSSPARSGAEQAAAGTSAQVIGNNDDRNVALAPAPAPRGAQTASSGTMDAPTTGAPDSPASGAQEAPAPSLAATIEDEAPVSNPWQTLTAPAQSSGTGGVAATGASGTASVAATSAGVAAGQSARKPEPGADATRAPGPAPHELAAKQKTERTADRAGSAQSDPLGALIALIQPGPANVQAGTAERAAAAARRAANAPGIREDSDAALLAALMSYGLPPASPPGTKFYTPAPGITMRVLPGAPLAERLAQCRAQGWLEAERCRLQVCAGQWGIAPECPNPQALAAP